MTWGAWAGLVLLCVWWHVDGKHDVAKWIKKAVGKD